MADSAKEKPLMPAGCWQIPSFVLFGAIAFSISRRHFLLVMAIGAVAAIIFDLVRTAIVDDVSPLQRLSDRWKEFAVLAFLAAVAAFHFHNE